MTLRQLRNSAKKCVNTRDRPLCSEEEFSCNAPIASEPTKAGARDIDPAGLPSKTEFRLLRRDPDGTALVEARPLTGRTNQIRAHLWHLGHPIVGDPVYLENSHLGTSQTLPLSAPLMCLHAHRLAFRHPVENRLMRFETPMPAWSHTKARSHEKEGAAVV